MNSVEIYKALSNVDLVFSENLKFPTSVMPNPNEKDYDRGFIKRSFCLKINSQEISEINNKDVDLYSNNMFLKTKTVTWKISGPERNIYKNDILYYEGVYEFNIKSIQELKKSGFKTIETFLQPFSLYKK